MILTEKETSVIKDLMTQEKTCIEKYDKYSTYAKDTELKNLFSTLKEREQQHYNSLNQVLSGTVPSCDVNDSAGKNYSPTATYVIGKTNLEDKEHDCFLCTDAITTEKLVSSEYNSDVFAFGDTDVRKLLADIQVEEQNHAEMIYKYKTTNSMT